MKCTLIKRISFNAVSKWFHNNFFIFKVAGKCSGRDNYKRSTTWIIIKTMLRTKFRNIMKRWKTVAVLEIKWERKFQLYFCRDSSDEKLFLADFKCLLSCIYSGGWRWVIIRFKVESNYVNQPKKLLKN